MNFGFEDEDLRALCNSGSKLRTVFGADVAILVQRILWSLDAASNLAELSPLPPISRRRIGNGNPPVFAVGSEGIGQVVFRPDADYLANDLSEIEKIQIIQIGGAD